MKTARTFLLITLTLIAFGLGSAYAQENLAQQVSAIFEQNCLNCHGEHGAFTESLIIEHTTLIETGAVVPRRPNVSELYKRLIENRPEKRMPLGQPPLTPAATDTIRRWILAGAPDWGSTTEAGGPFITPQKMLNTIERHVNTLAPFDRTFARYFTMTHLYNAGETTEALHAYQRALSKLVNSLSWGREVIRPQPIDREETIFYIDLRDYEWEIGANRWTLIEAEYPYSIEFNAPTETTLREKLTALRQKMNCDVPFVHVDWFLASASLPPLYHDILGLPSTVQELETRLEVNVVENLQNAAGKRVWHAGFNNSGVSNHNRVVERHTSRYGAYWKSYDFAGSAGTQHIFTHPLSFTYDGGEVVFNLPNGLQAYYLTDGGGNRLDAAPISIVSNPAASDPTVRNGLSCIGCHTEGMKTFEDQIRPVIQQNANPPYNKAQALRLYVPKSVMNSLVSEDTQRYRQALEAAGDIFGGIEPAQRFYEAFQAPLDAAHAAAGVGLETETFLQKIRENASLQSLGLLVLETGTVKRDTWTSNFSDVVAALSFPDSNVVTPVTPQTDIIPGASVYISDPNLRAAVAKALGKSPNAVITAEEMATLRTLSARDYDIRDFAGLEAATNLEQLKLRSELITDLSDLARSIGRLKTLKEIWISGKMISDFSPLAELAHLEGISIWELAIDDISPLSALTNLRWLDMGHNSGVVSDLSPLANLTNLKRLVLYSMGDLSDLSPLVNLTNLRDLSLQHNRISDVSPLTSLSHLEHLSLEGNNVSDFSPIADLFGKIPIFTAGNPGFPTEGPKIEGPWLWMIAPTPGMWSIDAAKSGIDFLARMSKGTVTELDIATNGVKEGASLGNNVWTIGKISPSRGNINEVVKTTDLVTDDTARHVAYGLITIGSPKNQKVNMLVGSGDAVKVWLNGALVHNYPTSRGNAYYTEFFPVMLREGANLMLVAVFERGSSETEENRWTGLFGFEDGTAYTVIPPGGNFAFSSTTTNVLIGDRFTVDLNAEHVADLAGWQVDVAFDPTTLEAVEVNEGDFLKTGGGTTFFQKGTINNRLGKITGLSAAHISEDGVKGSGPLLSITFAAKASGKTEVTLSDFEFGSATGTVIPTDAPHLTITVGEYPAWDVNQDGRVSILDLIRVAQRFGETAAANAEADVNDGTITILDLILVAQHLGESTGAASPAMLVMDNIENLDSAMVQAWIDQAQLEDDGSVAFREGIAYLESLLALLVPEETTLLPNYPNPFNPETWIPYHLANASEVTISIYNVHGTRVRQLNLGHQHAGYYTERSRAAYWNGRNEVGERVASGIYFYQFQADNVSLLRKMLILK
ncbi:MAG: leucine-rich repeat domain-containing protein [Candidatus Poribacteria bacterium]|nr:leucine-rich repeat domain-containing protein [Candidatus Poribacteria bacterium]